MYRNNISQSRSLSKTDASIQNGYFSVKEIWKHFVCVCVRMCVGDDEGDLLSLRFTFCQLRYIIVHRKEQQST